MLIFALGRTREFGAGMARALGVELAPHEEREFEDGEHKARPLISVRGRDVYVVHSLYGDREATLFESLLPIGLTSQDLPSKRASRRA
jgi:ribose-phosphate pyrophosphokinase